jgi:hypothetical protein
MKEQQRIDPTTINGWAIDANPDDTPNYPMKNYTGADHDRKNWTRPTLQNVDVEVLMSTERPYKSAVVGTTVPPRGLSGMIRRLAFKYSEDKYKHWLPLILADRVDNVEGIFRDLAKGEIPNVIAERGWGAIGKYKPGQLAWKITSRILIFSAAVCLAGYFLTGKKKVHEEE